MSNLATIHVGTKELHKKAENLVYLTRYGKQTVSLLDHYCHLSQLLPLYEALEKKLKDKNFAFSLPEDFHEVLQRSAKIKADLAFLKPHLPEHLRQQVINKATSSYVQHLESLNAAESSAEIFAHFLVRILGDLFGGQKLKSYVTELYTKERVYSQQNPEQGVNFYSFPEGMLKKFSLWFNELALDDEQTVAHANKAFENLIAIFEELEEGRLPFSRSQRCSSFFNLSTAKKALLLGTALAAPLVASAALSYSK